VEAGVWRDVLVVSLAAVAVLGFGYRVYRTTKGGPATDAVGQAILGGVLGALAVAASHGLGWSRWAAFAFGVFFGLVVMPVWVLGVFIPMRPRAIDYSFAVAYGFGLAAVIVSALLA
jgi:hypothetical protein